MEKEKYINKLKTFFAIFLVIFMFGMFSMNVVDGDTFFHIKLGEWISNNGLPTKDMFSIHDNLDYSAYAFGFELLVYWIYNLLGFSGLVIFKYLFMLTLAGTLAFTLYKLKVPPVKALFWGMLIIISIKPFTQVRPQIISYLIFIIQLYIANKWINNKDSKIIWLTPITMLILNLFHTGVFFFHIGILAVFGIDILIQNGRLNNIFKDKHFYTYLAVGLISIFTIITNPYFPGIISYSFKTVGDNTMMKVSEWSNTPLIAILIYIVAAIYIFRHLKLKESPIGNYICVLMCFALMASHYRFYPYAFFSLAFMIPYLKKDLFCEKIKSLNILDKVIKKKEDIIAVIIFLLFFSTASTFVLFSSNITNYQFILSPEKYPIGAVNFIKENNISGRIYNSYNDGAYLIFNEIPVFVDPRCDPYSKSFNGVDVLDDEFGMSEPFMTIFDMAEKYDLKYALLKNNDVIYNLALRETDKYELLYEDDFYSFIEFNIGGQ